jgi:pimeloyl-ACP methyl ester carboxylesterase
MPVAAQLYYHASTGGNGGNWPVVLIHGAGGNNLFWPFEIRRLPGQTVYALDLPGHGKSEGRGQQSITGYIDAILAWLGEMNLNRAIFVGHSMGGAIVQALAIKHPELVTALGLIASGARLRVHPDILSASSSQTTYYNAVKLIIANAFNTEDARLVELANQRMSEVRASVLHGDFLACDSFDLTELVSGIGQPALVICGSADKMTPVRYSQFLASTIPGARLVVIPEAGHMVMLEKPGEVSQALLDFINELPQPI